ncbi:MAG: MipA/OmpV family protein [Opitutales bacterium]|nr:MipA/OmpV family protein [Opitutales bacterium]
MKSPKKNRAFPLTALCSLGLSLIAPQNASAQEVSEDRRGGWHVSLGLGARYAPTFPGASSSEITPRPLIDARYGWAVFDTFLIGTPFLGLAPQFFNDDLTLMGGVILREGRDPGDDDWLAGQNKIDDTAMALIGFNWTPGNSLLLLRGWAERDVLSNDHGSSLTLELLLRAPLPRGIGIQAGITSTWATEQHLNTWFASAVNRTAAVTSGQGAQSFSGSGHREWGWIAEGSAPIGESFHLITRFTMTWLDSGLEKAP